MGEILKNILGVTGMYALDQDPNADSDLISCLVLASASPLPWRALTCGSVVTGE